MHNMNKIRVYPTHNDTRLIVLKTFPHLRFFSHKRFVIILLTMKPFQLRKCVLALRLC